MESLLVVFYGKLISMSILEGEIEITSWIKFLSVSNRAYFASDPIYLLFFFTERKRDIGILQKANLWAYKITSKTFDESKRKRVSYITKSNISSQMQITKSVCDTRPNNFPKGVSNAFAISKRQSKKIANLLIQIFFNRFLFFASKSPLIWDHTQN